MSDTQHTHYNEYQDEISISELMMKLWRRRGLIVAIPVVFLGLAVVFLLLNMTNAARPVSYFISLEGVEKEAYPNGAAFSPSDLLLSENTSRIAKEFGIEDAESMRKGLVVRYGSPFAAAVRKKYEESISRKGVSAADIETLTESYKSELQSLSRSSLWISADPSVLGIGKEAALELVARVPEYWVETYKTKYRVLSDTSMSELSVARVDSKLQTTAQILGARDLLQTIVNGLNVLAEDNRMASLMTPTGYSAADLLTEASRFKSLYFQSIFTGLFSEQDQVSQSFLRESQLEIDELSRDI